MRSSAVRWQLGRLMRTHADCVLVHGARNVSLALTLGQSQQHRQGQQKMTVMQSQKAVQILNGRQNTSRKQPMVGRRVRRLRVWWLRVWSLRWGGTGGDRGPDRQHSDRVSTLEAALVARGGSMSGTCRVISGQLQAPSQGARHAVSTHLKDCSWCLDLFATRSGANDRGSTAAPLPVRIVARRN
jgi:hypothetical protein